MKPFKIAAIVCVRNEDAHIKRCIECLIQDGIEIIIIDHASEDATLSLASGYVGRGVIDIIPMEYKGYFSLMDQLELKAKIIKKIDHDWVMHIDADEWMHTLDNTPLCYALERASFSGYNCVNFEELVFVPIGLENFEIRDYHKVMHNYYYFYPAPNYRMCAWKRDMNCSNIEGMGHILSGGNIKLSPEKFVMRHYVCLSYIHFTQKFKNRIFSSEELDKTWHANREVIKQKFHWPENSENLFTISRWDVKEFNFSKPTNLHFWEWHAS